MTSSALAELQQVHLNPSRRLKAAFSPNKVAAVKETPSLHLQQLALSPVQVDPSENMSPVRCFYYTRGLLSQITDFIIENVVRKEC